MRSRQVDPAIHLTEEDSTRTLGIALELISLHDPLKILLVLPFPELIHSLTVQKPANSCALGVQPMASVLFAGSGGDREIRTRKGGFCPILSRQKVR